jgi:hypothetical protein
LKSLIRLSSYHQATSSEINNELHSDNFFYSTDIELYDFKQNRLEGRTFRPVQTLENGNCFYLCIAQALDGVMTNDAQMKVRHAIAQQIRKSDDKDIKAALIEQFPPKILSSTRQKDVLEQAAEKESSDVNYANEWSINFAEHVFNIKVRIFSLTSEDRYVEQNRYGNNVYASTCSDVFLFFSGESYADTAYNNDGHYMFLRETTGDGGRASSSSSITTTNAHNAATTSSSNTTTVDNTTTASMQIVSDEQNSVVGSSQQTTTDGSLSLSLTSDDRQMHTKLVDILKNAYNGYYDLVRKQTNLNEEIDIYAAQLVLVLSCIGSGRKRQAYNHFSKGIQEDIALQVRCQVGDAVLQKDEKWLILSFDEEGSISSSGTHKQVYELVQSKESLLLEIINELKVANENLKAKIYDRQRWLSQLHLLNKAKDLSTLKETQEELLQFKMLLKKGMNYKLKVVNEIESYTSNYDDAIHTITKRISNMLGNLYHPFRLFKSSFPPYILILSCSMIR